MRSSIALRTHTAIAAASLVASATKDIILTRLQFDVSVSGSAPVLDPESGEPLRGNDGNIVMRNIDRAGFGFRWARDLGDVPFFAHTLVLEGGSFTSKNANNLGQMIPGSNSYFLGYDLNLDKEAGLEDLDAEGLNQHFAGLSFEELKEQGYLVTDWDDENRPDAEAHPNGIPEFPGVEISARNYWGWQFGESSVANQDIPVFTNAYGFPTTEVGNASAPADGDEETKGRTRYGIDWDKVPFAKPWLKRVFMLAHHFDLPEDFKNDLIRTIMPDYMGGLTPRQSNAPSIVAEQKKLAAQQRKSAGGTTGGTTGLEGGTTEVEKQVNLAGHDPMAQAAKIPVTVGGGGVEETGGQTTTTEDEPEIDD